jgi:hypothetical protein
MFYRFIFLCRSSQNRVLVASLFRYLDHTQLDIHTPARTLNERSARRRRRCVLNTQHTLETNIHALSRIRTGIRPQTYALDCTTTGSGCLINNLHNKKLGNTFPRWCTQLLRHCVSTDLRQSNPASDSVRPRSI